MNDPVFKANNKITPLYTSGYYLTMKKFTWSLPTTHPFTKKPSLGPPTCGFTTILGDLPPPTLVGSSSHEKARKLRALLLSGADGEFQGLLEAISIPTNGCVLAASAVDTEVGVLQTLLANQTLCLLVIDSTLCNNPADHHAVQERINVDEQAEVLKKFFKV